MNSIMKGLGTLAVIIVFGLSAGDAMGQVLDGVYTVDHHLNDPDDPWKRKFSYAPLREADVMWTKRIWRKIDLREKINHPLYYPEVIKSGGFMSLFDVFKEGISKGRITAYDPIDDEFKSPMTIDEVFETITQTDTILTPHFDTGELVELIVENEVVATDMRVYVLKEDWFFDKQRSVQEVRIIGISPQVAKYDDSDNEIGKSPLFWIYYPEARDWMATKLVFNRQNVAERRTYDSIMHKRMFNSYISKESNVYDRAVYEYTNGIAYQLESERIKNELFLLEHDLWSF